MSVTEAIESVHNRTGIPREQLSALTLGEFSAIVEQENLKIREEYRAERHEYFRTLGKAALWGAVLGVALGLFVVLFQ